MDKIIGDIESSKKWSHLPLAGNLGALELSNTPQLGGCYLQPVEHDSSTGNSVEK